MKAKSLKKWIAVLSLILVATVATALCLSPKTSATQVLADTKTQSTWVDPRFPVWTATRGTPSATYNSETKFSEIRNLVTFPDSIALQDEYLTDGLKISFFAPTYSKGTPGFGLSTTHGGYITENTLFTSCIRDGGDWLFMRYGVDHDPSHTQIAFRNPELTETNYGIDNNRFYAFAKTSPYGCSILFEKYNDNVYKVTTSEIKEGQLARRVSDVSYVSKNYIPEKAYVVAYAMDAFNTTISYKVENVKTDMKATYNTTTDSTDISGYRVNTDRMYYSEKVELNGLSVTMSGDNFDSFVSNDVVAFGFSDNLNSIPYIENKAVNISLWPNLYDGQHVLGMNSSHNYVDGIFYKDEGLTQQYSHKDDVKNGHSYRFNSSNVFSVQFTFNKVSDSAWKMTITVLEGQKHREEEPNVLYFSNTYASSVLDAQGKCYLFTYGWSVSGTKALSCNLKVASGFTVTQIINGKETKVLVKNGKYTLPKVYNTDDLFIGWLIEGHMYYSGETVTVNHNLTMVAQFINLKQGVGASVRKTGDATTSGIRFLTTLNEESFNAYESYVKSIGIIIMPADKILQGVEFVYENYNTSSGAVKFELDKNVFEFEKGKLEYYASIVDLYSINHNRKISGRAFITLNFGRGDFTVYTDYTETNNARSVTFVATKALEAHESDKNNTLAKYSAGNANIYYDGNSFTFGTNAVIQSVTGKLENNVYTVSVTVDNAKFAELVGTEFKGVTINDVRVKATQSKTDNVLTLTFNKPAKLYTDLGKSFWDGDTTYDETILLVAETDNDNKVISAPKAKLLFDAKQFYSVKNYLANGTVTEYVYGKDYTYENGYIIALGEIKGDGTFDTAMPYITDKVMMGIVADPNYAPTNQIKSKTTGGFIPYSEYSAISNHYIFATYLHPEFQWEGPTIDYQGTGALNKAVNKLKNKQELKILIYGDSISAGFSSTKSLNLLGGYSFANNTPRWYEILEQNLESYYGTEVTVVNKAIAGYTSANGVNGGTGRPYTIDTEITQPGLADMFNSTDYLKGFVPDVCILAFGMNDAATVPAETYKSNMRSMINTVRNVNSNCEILLLGSFLKNPDADAGNQPSVYLPYLKGLSQEFPSIAVIDMAETHEYLFTNVKNFVETSSNNYHHPSDLMARVYAMNLLDAFTRNVEYVKPVSPSNESSIETQNAIVNDFIVNYYQYKGNEQIGKDVYFPNDVELSWKGSANSYTVKVSLNEDMSSPAIYETTAKSITLSNLYINQDYYWTVTAHFASGDKTSEVQTFSTTGSMRAIKIDGVSNTRDLGGVTTIQGFTVKQGMIYRSAKLDDITATGLQQVKALGIKSDLDLREASAATSPLASLGVQHFNYDSAPYYASLNLQSPDKTGLDNADKKVIFKQVFKVLTDKNNYPIDFHCSIGRDRTGTLAYVLYAILGVEETRILCDYEFSRLSVAGSSNTATMQDTYTYQVNPMRNYFKTFGSTLTVQEQVENYLLSIGITRAEINTVKKILLEGYVEPFGPEELPYDLTSTQPSLYKADTTKILTAEEAAIEGVPEGYTGTVIKLDGTSTGGSGMVFDFSNMNINIANVKSLTFRVYLAPSIVDDAGYPEVRVAIGTNTWIMRYHLPTESKNQWIDISLSNTGTNFESGKSFNDLKNENGTLGRFALIFRPHQDHNLVAYIDKITVTTVS